MQYETLMNKQTNLIDLGGMVQEMIKATQRNRRVIRAANGIILKGTSSKGQSLSHYECQSELGGPASLSIDYSEKYSMRFGLRGGDNIDLNQSQLGGDGDNEHAILNSNAKNLPLILE